MRHHKKAIFIISLTVLGLLCSAQTPRQVRALVDNANIRTRPELDAEVLDIAAKGTLFDVIEKAGPWYTIRMGKDETGQAVYGYIHESMVEPSGDTRPRPQDRLEPPPAPPLPPPADLEPPAPPREVMEEPVRVSSRDKLISGSFLKYGFGDHWLASFGFDLGLGRHFGIGLEFQPYFSNISEIDLAIIQMDIFVNLKLGFKLWFFTLYGGGGVGPDFFYANTYIEGQSFSEFKTMLAYHGIAGVAVNIGKIAVVFEYQPVMISDPDLDPDSWGQFFFVGLRF
ncbi:MAG TPA: SH3 domain-containing protein [Candidatus Desulfaltia sp.]|nr:SH3 domain-containing protein [Candidatus Desulfaltia sp.]